MQIGFYFDQARCTGCYTCLMACRDWHEEELNAEPAHWIKVVCIERGTYPDVSVSYLAHACLHCERPACVTACPVAAFLKREEDGIVLTDTGLCVGGNKCGRACQEACPYDIPQFGPEENARVQKCDLCVDRWLEGKKPICVESCPTRALDAGLMDDLRRKYGENKRAEGFFFDAHAGPSIVFKGKALR